MPKMDPSTNTKSWTTRIIENHRWKSILLHGVLVSSHHFTLSLLTAQSSRDRQTFWTLPDFLSDLSTSRSPDPREEYNLFLSDFVPDDVLDFVTDYSTRHSSDFDLSCRRYIGDDQLHHLPQTDDFENAESRLSDVLRNSHENDFSKSGSSSSDRKSPIKQSTHSKRRREINREASKRYRQRLKQKSLQTRLDLTSVISAYEQSKSAYEKAEHTFDVLKNIVLDLVNIVPRK
ncbi:hypothetical protein KSF78_0002927 [Schistosoma japonicum]|nr:hypothetical protein KSF78_0002927 [Schistosoma japonicum]